MRPDHRVVIVSDDNVTTKTGLQGFLSISVRRACSRQPLDTRHTHTIITGPFSPVSIAGWLNILSCVEASESCVACT